MKRIAPFRPWTVGEPGGAIDQPARGVDFGGHVRELELNGLEFADGFAELLAFLRVFGGGVAGALRHPQRERGDGDAPAVEDLQAVHEAVALLAQQIFLGHETIAEDNFGSVAGAHAQLVFLFAGAEAGRALLDDEGGDAVGPLPWSVTAMATQTSA